MTLLKHSRSFPVLGGFTEGGRAFPHSPRAPWSLSDWAEMGLSWLAEPVGSAAWPALAPSRPVAAGVVDLRENRQLRLALPLHVCVLDDLHVLPEDASSVFALRLPQGDGNDTEHKVLPQNCRFCRGVQNCFPTPRTFWLLGEYDSRHLWVPAFVEAFSDPLLPVLCWGQGPSCCLPPAPNPTTPSYNQPSLSAQLSRSGTSSVSHH